MKRFVVICLLLLASLSFGQKGLTTFGLQYKPIIPNRIIGQYEQTFADAGFTAVVKQKFGHSMGMLVRFGLTDMISLETGLGITQRNFNLDYSLPDSGYAATGDVRIISYSLPLRAMIFIRLSDEWYMNTSLGSALTIFPSDVKTWEPIGLNERFQQEGAYRSKIQGAALANVGFEYRTKSKGTWYLGAAYQLPYIPMMTFAMSYEFQGGKYVSKQNIRGSYLTLDLRYYFHEKKGDQ